MAGGNGTASTAWPHWFLREKNSVDRLDSNSCVHCGIAYMRFIIAWDI